MVRSILGFAPRDLDRRQVYTVHQRHPRPIRRPSSVSVAGPSGNKWQGRNPSAVAPQNPRTQAKLREREEMIGLFEVAFLGVMVVYGGIGVVFCVYLRMLLGDSLWEEVRGLTEEEVKKLEEGKVGAGGGAWCAVCLEEMVEGQVARVLPGCRHAFHRPCVDAWLQVRSACPLCRALLLPLILSQPQHQRQLPYSSS